MYKHLIFAALSLFFFTCKDATSKTKIEPNKITQAQLPKKTDNKNVEIVFCLDATGSMSGLIGTAKEKIWNIVSELAQSNDVDTLKMGMVFYRDKGDTFVTKQIVLTNDLDGVYADLMDMTADGGGDTPESLNKALNESVEAMLWSADQKTYRTIFVVGDCPPHMDYRDDVLYTVSCKKAAAKGIAINTIKLGNSCGDAVSHFKKIAACSNGEFLQLDQNATDYAIETPYDKEINKVSKKVDDSRLYYGDEDEQLKSNAKKTKEMEVYDKASSTANSARAAYKSSKSGRKSWMGSKEIVKDYKEGKVQIDELSEQELPTVLKNKTKEEKEIYMNNLLKERDSSILTLRELNKKRKAYIKEKESERKGVDSVSFSKEILKVMKKQSKEK